VGRSLFDHPPASEGGEQPRGGRLVNTEFRREFAHARVALLADQLQEGHGAVDGPDGSVALATGFAHALTLSVVLLASLARPAVRIEFHSSTRGCPSSRARRRALSRD